MRRPACSSGFRFDSYLRQLVPCTLIALVLLVPVPAAAQSGVVIGTVTAAEGQALGSADVAVVSTDVRTATDAAGRYRLSLPPGAYVIRVSILGRATMDREVTLIAGQTVTANFVLPTRAIQLDELVISLSAADTRREQFGTDIIRINTSEALAGAAITSFSDLLNSRAPGVEIARTSGEVGTASKIRIRGATSLTQDNNPIVYIDGVRVSNETGSGPRAIDLGDGQTISRLDDLNPEDIADVQVMKGPTAAAAYGSEAAAGVLIITTKRGSTGAPEFRLDTEFGASSRVARFPDNYFNLTRFGGYTDIDDPVIQQFNPVQNPVTGQIFARHNPLEQDNPFRTGLSRRTNLSVQGGTGGVDYYGSAGFQDEEGPLPNNDSRRVSMRGNFSAQLRPSTQLSFTSNYITSTVRTGGSGRSPTSIIVNALLGQPEFAFGTNPDGSQGDCLGSVVFARDESTCTLRRGGFSSRWQKIADVVNQQDMRRFIGGVSLSVRPTSWLSNRLNVGADLIDTRDLNILPLDAERPFGARSGGEVDDFRNSERIITFDYATTAAASVSEDLDLTTTVGAQYFGRRRDTLGCTGRDGFPGPNATACSASLTFATSTGVSEIVELGAFLQETAGWRDYLFASGALRWDDNSGFGANQGAIYSPSANASVVVSRMPFWNIGWVDDLRLRFAWGKAAQAPSSNAARTTFAPVRLEQGGRQVSGISPLSPGNPDLKPERKEEFEAGFDAAVLNNRLGFKFTYFTQQVTDAIIARRVSPGTGFSGSQFVNIGRVENKGIEAQLDMSLLETEDFLWNATLTLSTEDPIVSDMGGSEPIGPITGFFMSGMFHEGYAPGAYFGPVYLSAERNPDGSIVPGSAVLAPGNLDFRSNPEYRYLGRPNPSNQQTLSTSFTVFRSLTFNALLNRRAGHRRMDTSEGRRNCFILDRSGGRMCAFRQAELTPAQQAALESRAGDAPMLFLHDADFIKLREVTVRYMLPASLVARVGMVSSASITIGGRNLATWTDFPGVDPEADVSSGQDGFGSTGIYGELGPARLWFGRLAITF